MDLEGSYIYRKEVDWSLGIATAEKGQETFRKILTLKDEVDGQIVSLGRRAENARNLLLHL
jgi:hypothetical protein